jgi:peptidoglycan/LPS O-acetylase OafA/YrhL
MGILRLCLALAVVITHSEAIFGWTFTRLTGGMLAVQMFYVISGFYMALVLNRRYTGPGSYRRFVANRFLRLYPSYAAVALFTLLACGAVTWWSGSPIRPLDDWTASGAALSAQSLVAVIAANALLVGQDALMFFAIDPGTGGLYFTRDFAAETLPAYRFLLVPQAWTLGVELSFYLIAPFVVTRSAARIGVLLALGLALRVTVRESLGLVGDPWSYRFFPIELPLFLWGALAFKAYDALEARGLLPGALGAAALVFVLSAVALHSATSQPWQTGVLGVPMLCVALGPALPFLFHLTRDWPRDRALGELSYPVYIAHVAIVHLLRRAEVADAVIGLAACALALGSALALRRFVEAPIERWRHAAESERTSALDGRAHAGGGAAIRLGGEAPCPAPRAAPH